MIEKEKNELASEYAKCIVLCEEDDSASKEIKSNFLEGYEFLNEVQLEINKRFENDFGFNEDATEEEKLVVEDCYGDDFKSGLLVALLKDFQIDFDISELFLINKPSYDFKCDDIDSTINVVNKSKHRLPEYATDDSAGFDFKANIDEPWVIHPFERVLVPTGLFFEVPSGYELQVRPRSGMALKHGITVLNTPGTVDADYRGEVGIILINLSNDNFVINPGDRVAQGVINKVEHVTLTEVREISNTERGDGGFGHSGVK